MWLVLGTQSVRGAQPRRPWLLVKYDITNKAENTGKARLV